MAHLIRFEENHKIGYKDNSGNVVIEPLYSDGQFYFGKDSSRKCEYASVTKGSLRGIIDELGNEVIPFEYEDVFYLFDDLFAARKGTNDGNWKFGVINKNRNTIIPFEYKYISCLGRLVKCCKKANYNKTDDFISLEYLDDKGQVYEYSNLDEIEWLNSEGSLIFQGDIIENQKDLFITLENNKLGVINIKGDVLLNNKYDEIHCAREDRFVVRINDLESWSFGVVNNKDEIIIGFDYKYISWESASFYECYRDCKYQRDTKWQSDRYFEKKNPVWFNANGIKICESKAKILSDNTLAVLSGSKWGIYNKSNIRIINFLYDDIESIQNKFIVSKNGYIGILDENGAILIDNSYKTIENISINDNSYCERGRFYPTIYGKYSKELVFDTSNKTNKIHRNQITYKSVINLSSSKDEFNFDNYFILTTDNYSELFSLKDGILTGSRFDEILHLNNVSFAVRKKDKWGVYRADISELIIECQYDRMIYEGGHSVLLEKDGLWGAKSIERPNHFIFNLLYNIDIPNNFKEIIILDKKEKLFGVKIESKNHKDEKVEYYSIVDNKGNLFKRMSKFPYLDTQCSVFDSNFDRILASRNKKLGFISAEGYVSIPFQYDEVLLREDGNFDVCINNVWGVINISGKDVVTIKYSQKLPEAFSNAIVQNALTGRYGVLSENGTEKVPSIYEHIQIKDGYIFFGYGGWNSENSDGNFFSEIDNATWGVINLNGDIIIKPKYDCYKIQDGFLLAGRDGSMLYHDDSEYGSDYSGVYDLYSENGELIFGGITEFNYDKEKEILILFFGGKWDCYSDHLYDYGVTIHDYRFVRGLGLWLFLDKNLKSIIRDKNGEFVTFKKGTICNIEIKQEEEKRTFVYNIPIRIMARGFSKIEDNAIIISDSNNENERNYAAVEISSGKQTLFYAKIQFINDSTFFFSDNGKVGIANFDKEIIPAEYLFFTEPVHGFFFAAEEIDKEFSRLHLLSINDMSINIVAIEKAKTESIIDYASFERLLLDFDGTSFEIKDIIVSKLEIFDKSFKEIVSQKESNYWCSRFENCYWFSDDYRMRKEVNTGFYGDDDEPNYAEDTWYALTDGMYGDYPGGDVDYEVLGF